MIDGGAPDSDKVDDKGDDGTQLQLATLQGSTAEDGPKEEDKTGSGTLSEAGTADDNTIAAAEDRYDEKVDEATRNTGGSSGSSSGSSSSSSSGSSSSSSSGSGSSTIPNTAPQLASISGLAFSDTSGDDSFSNETGTLTGSDADTGDTLTYAISGQSADNSRSGFTHSEAGTYGTLYIDSASGAYEYVPNDSAIEGASSTQTDSFTLSVSDGTANATQGLTVTINGVDDVPTLASPGGISLTDTPNNDIFTVASATMSVTERDTGDTITHGVMGGAADTSRSGFTHSNAGNYGTLFIDSATGAYEYVPDDSAVEALATQVTESFDLSISDGTSMVRDCLLYTSDAADE